MADMIGLAASAAGGGLFGLVGTALGRVAGFFERRQEQAQERARWAHETALHEMQMRARAEETEGEIALAEAAGRWQGLSDSLKADAALVSDIGWVNAVRALTRPVLTFLLWAITAAIFVMSDGPGQAAILETTSFAATAATLWWFGDRSQRRPASR